MQRMCRALVHHTCFLQLQINWVPLDLIFLSILSKKRNYNFEAAPLCGFSFLFYLLRLVFVHSSQHFQTAKSFVLFRAGRRHRIDLRGKVLFLDKLTVAYYVNEILQLFFFWQMRFYYNLQSWITCWTKWIQRVSLHRVSLKSTLILSSSAVVSYTWIAIFNKTNYVFIWTLCIKKCISVLDEVI